MSWGIVCSHKDKLSETLHEPLCITMVALEPDDNIAHNETVSLMLRVKDQERLICTLIHGKLMQQLVQLKFSENEELEFFVKGIGKLHVLGHMESRFMENTTIPFNDMTEVDSEEENETHVDDEDDDDKLGAKYLLSLDDSGDDLSDENWEPPVEKFDELFMHNMFNEDDISLRSNFNDAKVRKSSTKKKVNFAENSFIEPDESYVLPPVNTNDLDVSSSDDGEDEDDQIEMQEQEQADEGSSDADENRIETVISSKKRKSKTATNQSKRVKIMEPCAVIPIQNDKKCNAKKTKKKGKKIVDENQPAKQSNDDLNSSIGRTPMPKNKKLSLVYVKCPPTEMPPPSSIPSAKSNKTASSNKLMGGIEYEDVKVGSGPAARKGKLVHVHYTGKFCDGKIFDKCLSPRKAFAFRLGRDEVIKGWDIGIEGMKVGGKRTLKIPPSMAYGKTGQGPIPPNTALMFTVELKGVNG